MTIDTLSRNVAAGRVKPASRYAVYDIFDKYVSMRGDYPQTFNGKVRDVFRCPMNHTISVTVWTNGLDTKYVFREPDCIYAGDGLLYFWYGDKQNTDNDESFFEEARKASEQGEGIDSVFNEATGDIQIVEFSWGKNSKENEKCP